MYLSKKSLPLSDLVRPRISAGGQDAVSRHSVSPRASHYCSCSRVCCQHPRLLSRLGDFDRLHGPNARTSSWLL